MWGEMVVHHFGGNQNSKYAVVWGKEEALEIGWKRMNFTAKDFLSTSMPGRK
jgi:hypothetical protein